MPRGNWPAEAGGHIAYAAFQNPGTLTCQAVAESRDCAATHSATRQRPGVFRCGVRRYSWALKSEQTGMTMRSQKSLVMISYRGKAGMYFVDPHIWLLFLRYQLYMGYNHYEASLSLESFLIHDAFLLNVLM